MRGITIILGEESVHTGTDLDMVQEMKNLANPDIQSYLVEVPGRNGLLNLTKGLTGTTNYYNRLLTFQYFATGTRSELIALVDRMNIYHGETIKIIDDDTPDYYYEGEASVATTWSANYVTITLTVNAYPFRYKTEVTSREREIVTTRERNIIFDYDGMPVNPRIIISDSARVTKDGVTYNLTAGTYDLRDILITRGSNTVTVIGSGTVTLQYREAKI